MLLLLWMETESAAPFPIPGGKVIEYRIGGNSDILQQISGATRSTYTIRSEDVRSKIRVKVSYRDDNSFNHELESNFTAKVTPASNATPYVCADFFTR